jgi:GTP-binding protein YchF
MNLSCGIIGLPLTGKTTFFNLLTRSGAAVNAWFGGKSGANTGHARIPDERVDYLSAMFKPLKTTYAQIEIIDVPGLTCGKGKSKGQNNEFLAAVKDADALAHIIRVFYAEDLPYAEGSANPARDAEIIATELLFADLQLIENRLNRISGGNKKKMENPLEKECLEKCASWLEDEKPLRFLELSPEEKQALKHITFLTAKPMLIAINADEKQIAANSFPGKEALEQYCDAHGYEKLLISAKMEEEIAQLPPEEQQIFLNDLRLEESGTQRMAKALYKQLGLISFLTAGTDEVRAWPIASGLNARQAAGKIHSDLERGFIRAETVAFSDLKEAGSMAAVKEKGRFRSEGKEYLVRDGDIINFLFNV